MAEPQRLPSGAYRVQWLDGNGKRRSATFKTYDAARSALRRRLTEIEDIRAGRSRPLSDLTLTQAAVDWLEKRKPAKGSAPDVMRRRGKRVRTNEQHLYGHILPELGSLHLPAVTPEVVQRLIRKLESKPTARKGEKNDGKRARSSRRRSPAS